MVLSCYAWYDQFDPVAVAQGMDAIVQQSCFSYAGACAQERAAGNSTLVAIYK